MATTTDRYLSYPAAAAGISKATSGGASWSYSTYVELVPASTITSNFYIAGLSWCWHTPMGAVDTTYQFIIEIATGADTAEVLLIQFPTSVRADALAGYVPLGFVTFSEMKYVPANTRLSLRLAYSAATAVQTLEGIKLFYKMP
jgi:hypothetical protein